MLIYEEHAPALILVRGLCCWDVSRNAVPSCAMECERTRDPPRLKIGRRTHEGNLDNGEVSLAPVY